MLLTAMLDAVHVDTIDKKGVVSLQPKPAFRALFDLAIRGEEGQDAVEESTATPGTVMA